LLLPGSLGQVSQFTEFESVGFLIAHRFIRFEATVITLDSFSVFGVMPKL
jgi:hypothetical protein